MKNDEIEDLEIEDELEDDEDEDEDGEEAAGDESQARLTRAEEQQASAALLESLVKIWPGPKGILAESTVKKSRRASDGSAAYFTSAKIPQDAIAIAAHGCSCHVQGPIGAVAELLEITVAEAEDIEEGWHGTSREGFWANVGFQLREAFSTSAAPSADVDFAGMRAEQAELERCFGEAEARTILEEREASQRRREAWETEAKARRAAKDAARRAKKQDNQAPKQEGLAADQAPLA